MQLTGAAVLLVGLLLDTVDGLVARRTGQASLFGGVLDIAADRTYELVLWVSFADLGLIPAWVPFVILSGPPSPTPSAASASVPEPRRSTSTARRSGASGGLAGDADRVLAGQGDDVCGLAAARALAAYPAGSWPSRVGEPLSRVVAVALWATVLLCVVRGLPVIVGGLRRHLRIPGRGMSTAT